MSTGNEFQWKHTSNAMSLKSVQPRLVAPRIIVQNAKTGRQVPKRQGSRQSLSRGGSFVRSSSSVGELSAHASMWGGSGTPSGTATPVAGTHSKPSLSMEYMFRPMEMPSRQDVLIIPAPVQAFAEAISYFEKRNKEQKPAGRHSEDPQYPLHPLVDPRAHRPSSAPSIVRWRHDPSSYQAREKGADKVRQHQLLNHEPPRGVSNRPLTPTPRLASNRPSSPEWLVCGLSTKRSPRTEPAAIENLIFDSAERLEMLKAAKSCLSTGTSAVSTSYRPSRYSPRIYAPAVSRQSAGFSEQDTIAPYQRVVQAVPGARTKRTGEGSPGKLDSYGTDASPQMSHVLAKDARYKRNIQYFETQHSLKQEHLRALDSAHKARQVAVSRGARISPKSFKLPIRAPVAHGLAAGNPKALEKYVFNATVIADVDLGGVSPSSPRSGLGRKFPTDPTAVYHQMGRIKVIQTPDATPRPTSNAALPLKCPAPVAPLFLRRPG